MGSWLRRLNLAYERGGFWKSHSCDQRIKAREGVCRDEGAKGRRKASGGKEKGKQSGLQLKGTGRLFANDLCIRACPAFPTSTSGGKRSHILAFRSLRVGKGISGPTGKTGAIPQLAGREVPTRGCLGRFPVGMEAGTRLRGRGI